MENEALLTFARSIWPNADRCLANESDPTITDVVDSSDLLVGKLAQTSPFADAIVGYAGPSNLLLAISPEGIVQRITIARSADTAEHVRQVENNVSFWQQFDGQRWPSAQGIQDSERSQLHPDGVSGATLTSLAIAEAILMRIDAAYSGATTPPVSHEVRSSLKFPDPLTEDESRQLAAQAAQQFPELWDPQNIHLKIESPWKARIVDPSDAPLGQILRSGPLADHIVGYQGPSEVLMCLDRNDTLVAASFRGSFDNQRYARYVRDEASFWAKFAGRSIHQLALLDLNAEGIEGVSGATMTSMAVAETIRESCQRLAQLDQTASTVSTASGAPPLARARRWNLSAMEFFTIAVSCLAIPWSLWRWRGKTVIRLGWQAVCFLGLGWICGSLLSLALFAGWIQGGVPWQLAPGLTALLVITLVSNLFLKRNVYCDHLCPHGIAQQWLQKLPRAKQLQSTTPRMRMVEQLLKASGVLAIACVTLGLILGESIPAAWLEPFNTYVWRVGLTWSVVVWVASLAFSYFRPMAYCRHACPTGKLLGFIRFDPQRSKITAADALLALALVTCAATLLWPSS